MSSSSTAYSGSGSGSGSGAAGAGSGERLADVSGETPAIPRIPGSVADCKPFFFVFLLAIIVERG